MTSVGQIQALQAASVNDSIIVCCGQGVAVLQVVESGGALLCPPVLVDKSCGPTCGVSSDEGLILCQLWTSDTTALQWTSYNSFEALRNQS